MDWTKWDLLEESDKKAWDGILDKAKMRATGHHFNKGKEHAAQGLEANKMEAKWHDMPAIR
mgnify:CR=1 FL=1